MGRRIPWLHVVGGVVTGLALVLSTMAVLSLSSVTQRNCQQIELVKARIRSVMVQSASTLGRPGSAGYAYYLAHPRELAQAHVAITRSLHAFRTHAC